MNRNINKPKVKWNKPLYIYCRCNVKKTHIHTSHFKGIFHKSSWKFHYDKVVCYLLEIFYTHVDKNRFLNTNNNALMKDDGKIPSSLSTTSSFISFRTLFVFESTSMILKTIVLSFILYLINFIFLFHLLFSFILRWSSHYNEYSKLI